MSKLTSEQGSILVATVAFTVVMAIAGSGLMMMSGNAVNHEQQTYRNDRAFLAAESGLQLGTQWLADTVNWNATIGSNVGRDPVFDGDIGGIPVRVWLEMTAEGATLNARASTTDLEYDKRLSWVVAKAPNPAVFINDIDTLTNTWFDGPFHSNTPLIFTAFSDSKADPALPYFTNGPVSVHNDTDHTGFPSGDYGGFGDGPSGNNYDFGIHVTSGGGENAAQRLDNFFQSTYRHSQPELYLPASTAIVEHTLLPLNHPPSTAPGHRALLFYHIDPVTNWGRAAYFYYNESGIRQSFYRYIHQQVLRAQNDVNVIGTVRGRTTLVTNPNCDIYPVGDLVYDGFVPQPDAEYDTYDNRDNYGIPADNTSILALVSGGNICFGFHKQEMDPSGTTLRPDTTGESMYLTALLYAYEDDHSLVWRNGCHFQWHPDLMDHEQFTYDLRAIGGRVMDRFFNYTLTGGAAANQKFRFFADTRINDNFTAPGVPGFLSTGANGQEVNLITTNWSERNIPR